jgi:hypothetical protein
VVGLTPGPLYSQGKSPWYPLDMRLGGPQSRSGRGGEEKNSQPLPGLEPPVIHPVAQRYTTELYMKSKLGKVELVYPVMKRKFVSALCRQSGTGNAHGGKIRPNRGFLFAYPTGSVNRNSVVRLRPHKT